MSYVESNLLAGEKIEAIGKVHWWAWGKGVALMIVGMLLPGAELELLRAIVISLGVIYVIRGVIIVMTTELAITNRRVIAKFGLIRRSSVELLHHKIEGLNVDQSVFGRILGFGTVMVNGTGAGRTPVSHITRPLEFRRNAMERIEQGK